ncbi:MAG: glycerophosphodiester phosphodiesterase [Oscillospiraceae bacterium]|nr:glycerophosphodiester phosphodiesterase [Oscillospiraceae bacterium]
MMGRTGHEGWKAFAGWSYAHRGLHGNGVPENSMLAFRKAKQAGYGIEFDVHLTKDGTLAVIHDFALNRSTGLEGDVENLRFEDLSGCYLEGTLETIPVLQDVLELYRGEAPLIIELKPKGNNYSRLCSSVCRVLENYPGTFCLESFDPRCIRWLRKNRPDWIRGQLVENYLRSSRSKLPWYLKFLLTNQMLNFLTRPDFIAYKFPDRKHISNWICRNVWGLPGVSWTLKNPEEFADAVNEDWLPIFEGFLP